jgi:hypothetical protein
MHPPTGGATVISHTNRVNKSTKFASATTVKFDLNMYYFNEKIVALVHMKPRIFVNITVGLLNLITVIFRYKLALKSRQKSAGTNW